VVHGFVREHGDKRNGSIGFKIALGFLLCLLFLSLCNVSWFLGLGQKKCEAEGE
jgi:hypothetical protein